MAAVRSGPSLDSTTHYMQLDPKIVSHVYLILHFYIRILYDDTFPSVTEIELSKLERKWSINIFSLQGMCVFKR
jgi:hypothetical protein